MRAALLAAAVLLVSCAAQAAAPAFPGAEGFGAGALGGRKGVAHHVTTLADSGPGSLRACVEASGPRTCIFRVAGTIVLERELAAREPFLTVAGQTAPGGGIQIRLSGRSKQPAFRISTHDVIVRHLRIRRGATSLESHPQGTCCGDSLALLDARAVMLDHLSIAFATDENIDLTRTSDVTIQHSIIAYGLRFSTNADTVRDPAQHHSMGLMVGPRSDRITLFGNLLAFNLNRNPRLEGGLTDMRGNLVFGAGANPVTADGEARLNLVGNSFDPHPQGSYPFVVRTRDRAAVFALDNDTPVPVFAEGSKSAATPFAVAYELSVGTAIARAAVLEGAGALPRDVLDAALLARVRHGDGALIDDPGQVGGWPLLESGAPWPDSDRDGMDDRWERANGLSAEDPGDGRQSVEPDGYTNLERFLNTLVQPQ